MSRVFEEILEAVWKADERGDNSERGIRRGCPIEIEEHDLEALERRRLITRAAGRVRMTVEGRDTARSVVRRHRLAETLFATILDLDAERREAVACEVEHNLLPEVEEAICILLGHPTVCPDNKPIPPGRCCAAKRTMASAVTVSLTELEPGERGRITFIKPQDHARLHRLASFGLTPGTVVQLHQRSPAYCVRYEGTELALDRDAAHDIYVARIRDAR